MTKELRSSLSLDEKLKKLSREIYLASRWDKPGIFIAVYESALTGAKAVSSLEARLTRQGQSVRHIAPDIDGKNKIVDEITKSNHWDETVFFVMHLGRSASKTIYQSLDAHSNFFVNNHIRVVYWLAKEDFFHYLQNVPEYWFSQHRLMQLQASPSWEDVLGHIVQHTWQDFDSDPQENFQHRSLAEHLSLDIREDLQGLVARARLLIKLGLFYSDQEKHEEALFFAEKAKDIAEIIKDDRFSLEAEIVFATLRTKLDKYDDVKQLAKKASLFEGGFIWRALGNLYLELFMFNRSISAYNLSLEFDAENPMSWQGLGKALRKLGQPDKAIDAFQKALQAAPNFAKAWEGLAKAYRSMGETEQAIAAYHKTLESNYQQAQTWFQLGSVANDAQAQEALQHALELDSNQAAAWNLLGNIYFRAEKTNKALQAYYHAIQLDKTLGWGYANMALVYTKRKKYENAVLLYLKALQNVHNDLEKANMLYKLGNAYKASHKYRQAVGAYRDANELQQSVGFLDENLQLPGPFRMDEKNRRAPELDQSETERDEEPATATEKKAPIQVVLKAKLKKEKKNIMLKKILETNKKARKVEYWLELGNHYVRNQMYDLAEDAFLIAIELEPTNGWTYYNLALANTVNGAYRDAVPLYEKSIHLFEKKKDKASSWNQLGNVYRRLNEPSLAVAAYEKARVLDPPKSSLISRARLSLMSNCYAK